MGEYAKHVGLCNACESHVAATFTVGGRSLSQIPQDTGRAAD